MEEDEVIELFKKGLETFAFAVHVHEEVSVNGGRADIRLPDYDIVIEAKGSHGSIKSAIGQVLWYAEEIDDRPYIAVPVNQVTRTTLDVCESNEVGVIVVGRLIPRVVNDIGGLEAFDLYSWDGQPDFVMSESVGDARRKNVL